MKIVSWLLALVVAFVGFVAAYTSCCACGHLQPGTLPVLAIGGLLLWLWTLGGSFVPRALLASVPVLLLGENLIDVLWGGHEPLWAGVPRPSFLIVDPQLSVRVTLLAVYFGSALAVRHARRQREGEPVPEPTVTTA